MVFRLEVIQTEAMRAIFGCVMDNSREAMRHLLGRPTIEKRRRIPQVKAFLGVGYNPLHAKICQILTSKIK